ncbi:MAG: Rhomboid-like protein [Proteobacteria bacterium]|nr:Rhomboid-like protein [Pseudomonadota bacterium]
MPQLRLTPLLIAANVLIFAAMLLNGASLWHAQNTIQLAWGANFGPATQDGEWWRLGSALFLHFGILHLLLNMAALWDVGQWVERMYGTLRFAVIYLTAGLTGNLLSLVANAGAAVSGGASGAIFGIYGALLSYLWLERSSIHPGEFRWLFWAAMGFSGATIIFGLLVPGIDNAAHVGGWIAGVLMGVLLIRSEPGIVAGPQLGRWVSGLFFLFLVAVIVGQIPKPAYRWSEEKQIRGEVFEFLQEDAAITRNWDNLLWQGGKKGVSADELADAIERMVAERYDQSFEELLALPIDGNLPSAPTVEHLKLYAEQRRDASRAMVEGLRARDKTKIKKALDQARQSGKVN